MVHRRKMIVKPEYHPLEQGLAYFVSSMGNTTIPIMLDNTPTTSFMDFSSCIKDIEP